MDKEEIKTFSIITLGECGVGKTAIIKRFVDDKFEDYESTTGVNYSYKEMLINKKDKIILRLVDTTGQEKFRALTKSYFKNADAVLFVFSLDNKDTFYTITDWMELFNNNNNREEFIPKYLVGTKNDLKINVEQNLIDKFVQKYNIPFKSTSAKENKCIDELFEEIGKKLYLDYLGNLKKGDRRQTLFQIQSKKKQISKTYKCCNPEL
jgi:small GTP-binding protein